MNHSNVLSLPTKPIELLTLSPKGKGNNNMSLPFQFQFYSLIDHGDGLIALRILNPLAINSGFYTCMVASEFGCCSTSCEVTIEEAEEFMREIIPAFIEEPVPVVAMHGSVVSFCARVSPATSKFKWFLCGREITENSRGTIVSTIKFFSSNQITFMNIHIRKLFECVTLHLLIFSRQIT